MQVLDPQSYSSTVVSWTDPGWRAVYDRLKGDGYGVRVVQNPTLSVEGDAAATSIVLHDSEAPSSSSATPTGGW